MQKVIRLTYQYTLHNQEKSFLIDVSEYFTIHVIFSGITHQLFHDPVLTKIVFHGHWTRTWRWLTSYFNERSELLSISVIHAYFLKERQKESDRIRVGFQDHVCSCTRQVESHLVARKEIIRVIFSADFRTKGLPIFLSHDSYASKCLFHIKYKIRILKENIEEIV